MELLNLDNMKENIQELQNSFLNSEIGKFADQALDEGLKYLLPDLIENQVIEIKDAFLKNGFNEGINQIINTAKNTGETIKQLITGDFKDISKINELIKENGILDGFSKLIDNIVDKLKEKNILSENIAELIKKGKSAIISLFSNNLEKLYKNQSNNLSKIEKYISKWKEGYLNENFSTMEKNFNKLKQTIQETIPVESVLKEYQEVENIQTLIQNNGNSFELSPEEKELATRFVG